MSVRRHIGEPNEGNDMHGMWPVILGELDHDGAREFGLSDTEIAQCESMLDRGKQPTFYPSMLRIPLVDGPRGMIASVALGVAGVGLGRLGAMTLGVEPSTGGWVALLVVFVTGATLIWHTNRATMAQALFRDLLTVHSADLEVTQLWRRAVEAFEGATSRLPLGQIVMIASMVASLRKDLLPLAKTRTSSQSVEDMVDRIEQIVDEAKPRPVSMVSSTDESAQLAAFREFLDSINPDDFDKNRNER